MSEFVSRIQELLKSGQHGTTEVLAQDLFGPLPPIKRDLWIQLPMEVRNLLEECGYRHFNPEIDSIEVV